MRSEETETDAVGSYDARKRNQQNYAEPLTPFIHLYMSPMLAVEAVCAEPTSGNGDPATN